MSILLSHNSSLECLRAIPPQANVLAQTQAPLSLQDMVPARGELSHLDRQQVGLTQGPLHHLLPADAHRSEVSGVTSHRCKLSQIPAGLVLDRGQGIYVCGPELTFVQMASGMSMVGSVVLGHELCGAYAHFGRFASGFYDRSPLTTVARIDEAIGLLAEAGLHDGVGKAREALRWVRDGSASPMETVVSCMLHLPCALGGFGLAAPTLNYVEGLDEAARRIASKATCRVDTAYVYEHNGVVRKVGMEFDGKEYHRDAGADRARREALAHMGWEIYVVDVDDMTKYARVRDKVALLGEVPRQSRAGTPDEHKGEELLERLLRATRFGVGLEPVLFAVPLAKGSVRIHV